MPPFAADVTDAIKPGGNTNGHKMTNQHSMKVTAQ
jgi:hypothetical protein